MFNFTTVFYGAIDDSYKLTSYILTDDSTNLDCLHSYFDEKCSGPEARQVTVNIRFLGVSYPR